MSYQLDLDKGVKPIIAMPPLPQEEMAQPDVAVGVVENQNENGQDVVENPISPAQAAPEEVIEPLQATQKPVQETYQAGHFKKLRLEAEQVKAERDDMARRLAQYEASQRKAFTEPEPEYNMNPDDLVEGKHLNQYSKRVQQLEKQLTQYQQQTVATVTEARLKAQYPDFDKVVNEDNIEQLRYSYPELANTLNSGSDLYSTAVSAYTMIKKLGIVQEERNSYMADKAQAQKNATKPKSAASVSPQQGDSPLSKANSFANGLTEDLKKQLLREMQDARKGM